MIDNLSIESTDSTPEVKFETTGNLLIKGRSFLLDTRLFFQPLFDWVNQLDTDKVRFTFIIEYCNSASLKQLFEILKIIDSNKAVNVFEIIWKFETDDEDILEMGQMFEEKLENAKFLYEEYAEA